MLDFKTAIFSHNLYEKREFSAANDHCANYPFCDNGISLRPSGVGESPSSEFQNRLFCLLRGRPCCCWNLFIIIKIVLVAATVSTHR